MMERRVYLLDVNAGNIKVPPCPICGGSREVSRTHWVSCPGCGMAEMMMNAADIFSLSPVITRRQFDECSISFLARSEVPTDAPDNLGVSSNG